MASVNCVDIDIRDLVLIQDGEFIETFLLPYDGLYDALVVIALPSSLNHQLSCITHSINREILLTLCLMRYLPT